MATRFIDKEFGVNSTTAIANDATGLRKVRNLPDAAGLVADAVDFKLKYNQNGAIVEVIDAASTQTLVGKTLTSPTINSPAVVEPFNTYAVDAAITVAPQVAYLTKTSAGAYTLAAPGTAGIGMVLQLTTGTDFAHVVTFTGTTLNDGTSGANSTWTAAAVAGSSLTVVGVAATKWNVLSFNLGTIAP